jgi:hypothetical protein
VQPLAASRANANRTSIQAELQRTQDEDARKRDELQERLEAMVTDVSDVIQSKEQDQQHGDVDESDEVYVSPKYWPSSCLTSPSFRQRFKSFVDQYELRELHFQSQMRAKDLEIQYNMARYNQLVKAQEMEWSKSTQLTKQVSTFSQTETELRSQLNIYVEKFKQVRSLLRVHLTQFYVANPSHQGGRHAQQLQ